MEKPYYHWRWAAQENFCGKIAGIYGVKPAVQSVAVKTYSRHTTFTGICIQFIWIQVICVLHGKQCQPIIRDCFR